MFRALSMMVFGHPADRQGRRASQWPALRREFLLLNKICAACGGRENLTPHHVKPFHLFPELELEMDNLIPLCEGSVFNCHLFFGHLGNWASFNDQVRRHTNMMRKAKSVRPASIWELHMEHQTTVRATPLAEWHEETGPVLWWKFPIAEPPYVGTPLDSDWPGYHTHFTSVPLPAGPRDGDPEVPFCQAKETGRWSSKNPPLANISKKREEDRPVMDRVLEHYLTEEEQRQRNNDDNPVGR